jgi:hypothetical protein
VRLIEAVQQIETLAEDTIAEISRYMLEYSQDCARRGVDPYTGEAWAKKKDGTRALPDAPSSVSVRHWKRRVELKVSGGEAFHQKGSTYGKVRRRIIPDKTGIPPRMAARITEILQRSFAKKLEGA